MRLAATKCRRQYVSNVAEDNQRGLAGRMVDSLVGPVVRPAQWSASTFPLSFLMLGLGFLLGLVRADRRELHDLIASTAVIYGWDAEVARLRAGGAAARH